MIEVIRPDHFLPLPPFTLFPHLAAAEHVQDLVLDLLQLLLVLRRLDHQLLTLSFQVRPLLSHSNSQQLVTEAVKCDHEVQKSDLWGKREGGAGKRAGIC